MGFSDVWNRTLVYFGIAEDDEWDEDGYVTNEELERSYGARERANVRNERRLVVENEPYGLADEEVFRQLFPAGHPYHARYIGSHGDVAAVRLDEAKQFFDFLAATSATLPRTTWRALTPRFALEYRPNPNILTYVSATRGFNLNRAGPAAPGLMSSGRAARSNNGTCV